MVVDAQVVHKRVISINAGGFFFSDNDIAEVFKNWFLTLEIVINPDHLACTMHGGVAIIDLHCPSKKQELKEHI
jgi:hypothetical protein